MVDNPQTRIGMKRLLIEVAGSLDPTVLRRIAEATTEHVDAHYLPHEETAQMVVTARLEELRFFQDMLAGLLDELTVGEALDEDIMSRLIDYIAERRQAIKSLASRPGD
jgi:hypothetical protein